MKQAIINWISSRNNITLFQCVLYFIIGYVMGEHLTWGELVVMFVVMLCIQFITRTKAVADGMMFRQIMIDNQIDANDIVKRMQKMQKEFSDDSFKN